MDIKYILNFDGNNHIGRFPSATWHDRSPQSPHHDRNPVGSNTDNPGKASIGDQVTFIIEPPPNRPFSRSESYQLVILFARKRHTQNMEQVSTPFQAVGGPHAGLIDEVMPDPASGFLISPTHTIANMGSFEFSFLLRVNGSPTSGGRDYTRDPEMDVSPDPIPPKKFTV